MILNTPKFSKNQASLNSKIKLVLRLKGGLGNQLFQYAFARALTNHFDYDLIIDTKTGFFLDQYKRKPRVNDFLMKYKKAGYLDYFILYLTKLWPSISRLFFKSRMIIENSNDEIIQFEQYAPLKGGRITIIEGYFQSPIYFKNITDLLRAEVHFSPNINDSVKEYREAIEESESVAVHVRRIDYSDTLDISYYIEAIKLLSNKIIKPAYFIFSDDINWCRNEFHFLDDVCYVETNSNDELTDLYLMTRCANFIIANSSFSWWGAYLSRYENKIVVAPVKSTIETSKKNYPNNWICI